MANYQVRQKVVDAALGAGTFDRYEDLRKQLARELRNAETNDSRFTASWASNLRAQMRRDRRLVEAVWDDYGFFLQSATSPEVTDEDELHRLEEIFLKAFSLLIYDNDLFDQMFALGILTTLNAFDAAKFEMDARRLEKAMTQLYEKTFEAAGALFGTAVQITANVALTGIGAAFGPIGILAAGVAMIIADNYLGPDTSQAANWGSRTSTSLSSALSVAEDYLKGNGRTVKFVGPAGKVFVFVGVCFDANEVLVGFRNLDTIVRLMDVVQAAQDKLNQKVLKNRQSFAALSRKLAALDKEMQKKDSDGFSGASRKDLEDTMKEYGYRADL